MYKKIIFILALIISVSCTEKTKKSKPVEKLNSNELQNKEVQQTKIEKNKLIDNYDDLLVAFSKVVALYPSDSASLYNFYFKANPPKDTTTAWKHIEKLNALSTKESVEKYYRVEKEFKPLMKDIIESKTASKQQIKDLVSLYSDFDHFQMEAMFSQLFTLEEFFKLVGNSFDVLIQESTKDTCYISALIELDNVIKFNVELAESMPDCILIAIRNNPKGFLDMLSIREKKCWNDIAKYIYYHDEPDKVLMTVYMEISGNPEEEKYRMLAKELIDFINEQTNVDKDLGAIIEIPLNDSPLDRIPKRYLAVLLSDWKKTKHWHSLLTGAVIETLAA